MVLSESIYNDLKSGQYECVICLNNIRENSPSWNCSSCYRVFDLKCIRDWSQRNIDKKNTWSCPFCIATQNVLPNSIKNRCWCGKGKPRKFSPESDTPPHSCGKRCNAKRSCPHPCPLKCHAGPHLNTDTCNAQGPKIWCYCKKSSEVKTCHETQYNGFSCGNICGKKNKLCEHTCSKTCHTLKNNKRSPCGPCKEKVTINCFCGNLKEATKKCSDLRFKDRDLISKNGKMSCHKKCGRNLSCGNHNCEKECHMLSEKSHECPYMPKKDETCYCGKENANRKSCLDSVPSCGQVCGKKLKCGHQCKEVCHKENCPPCKVVLPSMICRCQYSKVDALCCDVSANQVICDRICKAPLSCKRHSCKTQCCEFAKAHKKLKPKVVQQNITLQDLVSGISLDVNEDQPISEAEEAAHLCAATCGKELSCGAHSCQKLCHAGKCSPCTAISFDEWRCPCGKTVLDPPINCGTSMPYCRFQCTRPRPCGHPSSHLCHQDDILCAPCVYLITFPCKCGKSQLKIPCAETDKISEKISTYNCFTTCGKQLPCGHECQQKCCDTNSSCPACEKMCTSVYPHCNHVHNKPCHFPASCPPVCESILKARCPCGVLSLSYECGEDMEIGCNETCLKEHYPESLLSAFESDPAWMTMIETLIRNFVRAGDKKSLWLKPMNRNNRRRVYQLIEHYGLDGESVDKGENRSVCVYLTESRWLPKFLLRNAPRKPPVLESEKIHTVNVENVTMMEIDQDSVVTKDIESSITSEGFTLSTSGLKAEDLTKAIDEPSEIGKYSFEVLDN